MGSRAALGVALFRRYWVASLVANAAAWMQAVALGWLVFEATHSPAAVGALALTARVPTLALSTAGGYLADRFDRRGVGLVTAGAQMLVAAALALPVTDLGDVRVLYAAAALSGTASALGLPATLALVGQIAGRRHRADAIALNAAGVSIARVVGPIGAGATLALAPPHACFVIVACACACMGAVLASVPPLPAEVRAKRARLAGAVGYAARNAAPRRLLVGVAVFTALGSPVQELAPVLAAALGGGPVGLGMLVGEMGLGAFAGAMVFTRLHRAGYPHHHAVPTATLGCALAGMMVALSPSLRIAGIAMMCLGFFWIWVFIATNTSIQMNTPSHLLGRILGLYQLAMIAPIAVGAPVAGVVAEHVGVHASMGGATALLAAWGVWSLAHRVPSIDGAEAGHEGGLWEGITARSHRAAARGGVPAADSVDPPCVVDATLPATIPSPAPQCSAPLVPDDAVRSVARP